MKNTPSKIVYERLCSLPRYAETILCTLAALTLLCGCKTATPTKLETRLFNFQTNAVEVTQTNVVTVTNYVPVLVTLTNNVTVTNYVPVPVTVTNMEKVWQTNLVWTPKPEAGATVATVVSTLAPGWGELAALVTGGALSIWATIRSRKANKTAATLAQGTETLLAFLETTPQGKELAAVAKAWLKKNQTARGVWEAVAALLRSQVSPGDAQAAAQKLAEMGKK